MKRGITQFIPENIPPLDAVGLGIYDGETKVCDVNISQMYPKNLGTKLYSFGLVSDSHLQPESSYGSAFAKQFEDALTWLQGQGAEFIAHCGDMTNHGFYKSDKTTVDLGQFAQYKEIRDKFSDLPIYASDGNHDCAYGDYTVAANRELLKEYTGHDIHHAVTYENDVYIFVGQTVNYLPMSLESLQWLYETLETNRNKRCFICIHPYIGTDSGNPGGLASNSFFNSWNGTTAFKNLLSHYKNSLIFHGHSHARPENQFVDIKSNYSEALGFRSFHVPSTAYCRMVVDGKWTETMCQSIVYIADVYERAVVLRAYDVIAGEYIPIGQYCIDTTLQTIEAGTFTDPTGKITT